MAMDKVVTYGIVAVAVIGAGALLFQQWTKKREADAENKESDKYLEGPAIWNPNLSADLAVSELADEEHVHETCKKEANERTAKKKKEKVKNGWDEWWWNTRNREDHWYEKYYEQCLDAYGGES